MRKRGKASFSTTRVRRPAAWVRMAAEAPAGPLRLRVGLYDPATGARLAVAGSDHLDLPGPTVSGR